MGSLDCVSLLLAGQRWRHTRQQAGNRASQRMEKSGEFCAHANVQVRWLKGEGEAQWKGM